MIELTLKAWVDLSQILMESLNHNSLKTEQTDTYAGKRYHKHKHK